MLIYNTDVAQVLAKAYVKYGLSVDEFLILNAYCMHSGFYQKELNLDEIVQMTGKDKDETVKILKNLYDRNKIQFVGQNIDSYELYQRLNHILEREKSIAQRIVESKQEARGSYTNHMGYVELIPFQGGGIGVTSNPSWGNRRLWSKSSMLKLADEIRQYAERITEEQVQAYNQNLEEEEKFLEEQAVIKSQEKEEEKKKRLIPKHGYIILIKFSNGLYKFTYTVSLSLQAKIENIKFTEGDTVQIIHHLETYDTLKFYHKFIKTQFSNRLDGKLYRLTDEDVQYIQDEKFPANAMEWFEGPSEKIKD